MKMDEDEQPHRDLETRKYVPSYAELAAGNYLSHSTRALHETMKYNKNQRVTHEPGGDGGVWSPRSSQRPREC